MTVITSNITKYIIKSGSMYLGYNKSVITYEDDPINARLFNTINEPLEWLRSEESINEAYPSARTVKLVYKVLEVTEEDIAAEAYHKIVSKLSEDEKDTIYKITGVNL